MVELLLLVRIAEQGILLRIWFTEITENYSVDTSEENY